MNSKNYRLTLIGLALATIIIYLTGCGPVPCTEYAAVDRASCSVDQYLEVTNHGFVCRCKAVTR